MKKLLRGLALPAALVAGIGVAATAMQAIDNGVEAVDAQSADAASGGVEMLASSFRNASKVALQGVVHVEVESTPQRVSQQGGQFQGTPFEDFFRDVPGMQMPDPGPRTGSGSGFIISPDGYVLTNNHVVENATRVTVRLTDRRQFEAEVVGRDPKTDIAVIKIDANNLPTVAIGDSNQLEVGDWVLALGYPMSLGETVTAGIVSAKGRSIGIMGRNAEDDESAAPLEHFIQTDAAINPGNSGGPLVNLQGQAIGVNSAIASPTGTYAGYGFAVPIALAKRVADDLIRFGAVHRPKLGVEIGNVFPADVEVFSLPNANGSVVRSVPDGPAKSAGIELGDVVVALDGQPVVDTGDLMERIAMRQPGDRVNLDVIRYGRRERIPVTLGVFENEAPIRQPTTSAPERGAVGLLGFAAEAVQGRLRGANGVVITAVDPSGPAPVNLEGMKIDKLNGREIRTIADLQTAARSLKAGDVVSVVASSPNGGQQTIVNYKVGN